jgi:hypothetical protein
MLKALSLLESASVGSQCSVLLAATERTAPIMSDVKARTVLAALVTLDSCPVDSLRHALQPTTERTAGSWGASYGCPHRMECLRCTRWIAR